MPVLSAPITSGRLIVFIRQLEATGSVMTTRNRDIAAAWGYHTATNHTERSVYNSSHHMDFDNQPRPFKIYRDLEAVTLPSGLEPSGTLALDCLGSAPTHEHQIGRAHV